MAETLGPFELDGQLGAGGMGIVYRARYRKNGRKVALKVLSPSVCANPKVVARFEREMAILEKLDHPHVVRYFGGAKQGDRRFYAMELMDGGSVDDELAKHGTIPWERVVEIASQTCDALQYSHRAGVVHRDLKPANLFVSRKGKIKLGDFGIAKDSDATALTEAGKTVGTYAYMAPEQITGKPPVSHKTDLYALGCVMFQMLVGRPPFEANNAAEMLYMHIQDDPPRVRPFAPDCPVWLESLVLRLLAKDPGDRPYDAMATKQALDEVREKVAAGASVSGATAAGGPTQLTMGELDRTEVEQIVKPKKKGKKKRKRGPFWEETWFLGACLGVVLVVVVWAMWPASEAKLYEEALAHWTPIEEALTEGADPEGTYDAREAIQTLLDRYPEGEHAETARGWLDELESVRLEREAKRIATTRVEAKSEAQRKFIEAHRYEQFGDRLTALKRYRALAALVKNDPENRPYLLIAARHIAAIEKTGIDEDDKLSFVESRMERAERLLAEGKALEAERIWNGVITLYATDPELTAQVDRARTALAALTER